MKFIVERKPVYYDTESIDVKVHPDTKKKLRKIFNWSVIAFFGASVVAALRKPQEDETTEDE